MIIGLSLITYWHFQKPRPPLKFEPPEFEMPEMNIDLNQVNWSDLDVGIPTTNFEWGSELSSGNEGEKEWVSPDGKIRLVCSNNWLAVGEMFLDGGAIIGTMLLEEEPLFIAYNPEPAGGSFPTLTVSQISPEKTLEEIMTSIEQNLERGGGEEEIVMSETEGNITNLEMLLKYPGYFDFYSKGKIIFTEEKTYLVFFTVPQKVWSQFEEEAQKIIGSVELLE